MEFCGSYHHARKWLREQLQMTGKAAVAALREIKNGCPLIVGGVSRMYWRSDNMYEVI